MWVDSFRQKIKDILPSLFPQVNPKIKITATLSVDSVVASSFLVKTFQSLGYPFSCSFSKKITDDSLKELAKDPADFLIFINPNFTPISKLTQLTKKQVIVIESNSIDLSEEVKILSPRAFSQKENIPASSIAYLLAKELYQQISDISYLIPIPYFDITIQPPEELLQEAVLTKKLDIKKGITIICSQTLPLHKAIANTLDPYLPKISGSEDSAVQLLLENNIPIRENSKFRSVIDLNEEETKRLLTAITLKRLGSEINPDIILGQNYILTFEDSNSIVKDLKCFYFLIECCLTYSKPSLALHICLNPEYKYKASEFTSNVTYNLVSAMEYYLMNKKALTTETDSIVIINMGSNLDYKLLNHFTRILSNSNLFTFKLLVVMVTNPIGQVIAQVEPPEPVYYSMASQLVKNLQKLIPIEIEFTQRALLVLSHQESEELLAKNIISASESLKLEEKVE